MLYKGQFKINLFLFLVKAKYFAIYVKDGCPPPFGSVKGGGEAAPGLDSGSP